MIHIHHEEHEYRLKYRIITVSSTRTKETDSSGDAMESFIGVRESVDGEMARKLGMKLEIILTHP